MVYYLIIALQIACAYHVYTSKNSYYWYFLILFFPVIGCAIYIITQLLTQDNVAAVTEEITAVVIPSKKINDLEQKITFSDTFQNRLNLADAYLTSGNFLQAEEHYKKALNSSHASDYYANTQLLVALYKQDKFEEVVNVAQKIESKSDFNHSKGEFLYGLALAALERTTDAEKILSKINQRYSNYAERLQLSQFYIANQQKDKAKGILTELQSEYENLLKPNRKLYQKTFNEVDKLATSLE